MKVTVFHNSPPQCASCRLSRHCLRWPGSAALPCYGWRVPVGARFFALPIVPRWPLPSRTQDLFAQDRFRKTFKKRNFSSSRAKTSWRVGAKTAPILEFPRPAGPRGRYAKAVEPPRRNPAQPPESANDHPNRRRLTVRVNPGQSPPRWSTCGCVRTTSSLSRSSPRFAPIAPAASPSWTMTARWHAASTGCARCRAADGRGDFAPWRRGQPGAGGLDRAAGTRAVRRDRRRRAVPFLSRERVPRRPPEAAWPSSASARTGSPTSAGPPPSGRASWPSPAPTPPAWSSATAAPVIVYQPAPVVRVRRFASDHAGKLAGVLPAPPRAVLVRDRPAAGRGAAPNARRKGDRYARHLDLTAPAPEARRTTSRGGLPAFPRPKETSRENDHLPASWPRSTRPSPPTGRPPPRSRT